MDHKFIYFLYIIYSNSVSLSVRADTYTVRVSTDQYVNLVDEKFLSFTIDPKYLFSSGDKYNTKECICMASSLTPAYIQIAGPSTSHMTFENTTISIDENNEPKKLSLTKLFREDDFGHKNLQFSVTHEQWEKFVHWAKNTGFDLVFALNNEEKTSSGMWDPNTALRILTVADKANIGEIFWQLGYECSNQSIEEYLNDLETLRVITETFPPGRAGAWRVVGGDVTRCLHQDSKSDFKDYVTLSNDMMDAILLDGNSSSHELERMSERERQALRARLSRGGAPLWLAARAAPAPAWLAALGHAARGGFAVHYRQLGESELYEPTLSFYMALLFKNLVGEKVLNVEMESAESAASAASAVFAHCTSLRRRPVPGAVTLYGANAAAEPARFSVKMDAKQEGGDILHFILGLDRSGNIVVNNRAMYYEGDIRPVVKRLRPYKTLLLNLPPKSFGFWVLANTQVEACIEKESKKESLDTLFKKKKTESNFIKTKRSIDAISDFDHPEESLEYDTENDKAIKERVEKINKDLRNIHRIFKMNSDSNNLNRVKRDVFENKWVKNLRKNGMKSYGNDENDSNILSKLSSITKRHLSTIKSNIASLKHDKPKRLRNSKRNLKLKSKRNSKAISESKLKDDDMKISKNNVVKVEKNEPQLEKSVRKRRSIKESQDFNKYKEVSSENEIPDDSKEFKLGTILHKLKKISEMPLEIQEKDTDYEEDESEEGILLKTKLSDDSATIDIIEKSHSGLLKSTLQDILSLLTDLNKHINRFWSALTILE